MNQVLRGIVGPLTLVLVGCSTEPAPPPAEVKAKPALLPEPVVNHSPADAQAGEKIEHGEVILAPDEAKAQLHAQHHPYKVLETRRVPGPFQAPAMNDVKDFALSKSELDVINPGPGEYVHRDIPPMVPHSFQNLDDEVAELVVIFPTNVWEYDVLDHFPFNTPEAKAIAEEAKRTKAQSGM